MSNPNRVQPGVPTGGQFAPTTHAESDVELTADDLIEAAAEQPAAGDRVLGADAARAVGRFNPEGPEGYRASTAPGAPLRATREEAEADERAHFERQDQIHAAVAAVRAEGRDGWDASNAVTAQLGHTDSDTDEYRRDRNAIAEALGMDTPYPAQAARDRGEPAPSEARREEANAHRQAAADSFERSDTDGFLSQHVSTLSGSKADLQGVIDDDGGRARFVALSDLDGNLVPAKWIKTQYGGSYAKLSDPDDPHSPFDGFINTSKAQDPERQRKYLADRGYKEVFVMAPAYADFGGGSGTGMGGMLSVRAVSKRTDGGFSRDVEILPDVMDY